MSYRNQPYKSQRRNFLEEAINKLRLPKNEEAAIQHGIVQYLNFNKILCWYTPNGTHIENPISRIILKLMGLKEGVSDLIILYDSAMFFVEVKTKTGKQTLSQKEFQQKVESLGHKYYIWRSIDDAENFVKNQTDFTISTK